MYQKIYNPRTNRKVSIYSRTGRLILNKYLEQIGGHTGKCSLQDGSCKQTQGDDDTENCKLIHYPKSGRKICSTLKSSSSKKPEIPSSIPAPVSTPSIVPPSISSPEPIPIAAPTTKPSPISVETPEIISRELCGINPDTNMCNAKFKDKDCVQILKNGRKVCVKADSIESHSSSVAPGKKTGIVADTVAPATSPTIPLESKYVFNNRFKDITYLYGAIGLSYYKFNTGYGETKKIFLISDQHIPIVEHIPSDSTNSINISEFIVYLTQSCSNLYKCVDFYLESALLLEQGNPFLSGGMYKADIPDSIISLKYMRDIFRTCGHNRTDEECVILKHDSENIVPTDTRLDNLRVHNIDLRQKGRYPEYDLVTHPIMQTIDLIDEDTYNNLLQYALGTLGHKTKLEIIDMLKYNHYFIIYNWSKSDITEYIEMIELVKVKIQKEQKRYNEHNIFGKHIDLNNIIYKSWQSSEMGAYAKGSALHASLVDMYTILRMFKNFETMGAKEKRGPLKCRNANEQNNIIVFAGEGHIDCYRRVFDIILPSDSHKYSSFHPLVVSTSKILEIDRVFGFENFNELMMDFCN